MVPLDDWCSCEEEEWRRRGRESGTGVQRGVVIDWVDWVVSRNCSSSSWRRHAFFEQLKARASIAITRSTDRWSWIQYCSYREHARLTRYMCVMVSEALNGTNTVCIPQDSIAKWTKLLQDTIIKISVEKNKNDRTLFHLNARIQVFSHFRIVPKFTAYTLVYVHK